MSNEIQIRSGLQIQKRDSNGNVQLFYVSQPQAFFEDMSAAFGPAPGAMQASVAGTDVDLSQFTTPARCRIYNLDPTNYVEVGIRDPATRTFYPLMEVLPEKGDCIRLSRNLRESYFPSTGTGTSTTANALTIKANKAACNVIVDIFEA